MPKENNTVKIKKRFIVESVLNKGASTNYFVYVDF
jgi:hypothetical protein